MNSRDALNLSIEPDAIRQLTPEQKDRLTDLLDRYFSQLEKGLPPSREYLLESNADLAGPLRAYFDSLDELHDMAAGFQRPAVDAGGDEAIPAGDERRLGDFRLLREIGRGGMGVVYEAEQISLGRRVAVKVLPFAAVLDSRQISRFKHEAQAAAQLNHPNIVSVFAVGVERGVHFYAMQLIDGQPLDRALAELREKYPRAGLAGQAKASQASSWPKTTSLDYTAGLVPEESESPAGRSVKSTHAGGASGTLAAGHNGRGSLLTSRGEGGGYYFRAVMQLGIEAAGALHAAHETGIVHRDIKPSNLLLDGNGKVWVTDFGLARRDTNPTLTRNGDLVGTLRYMSPEQALGQVALIDHRTDIYSLGATLYELLTLEPAFGDDEGPALLRHIERTEPIPLRQLQPKVPADLETVILKGMARRREDRYATAQEFADDLQRVMDGKPTVARPPSLLDRATRWAQRHREFVAVAGLIGFLALLGLAANTLLIAAAMTKTAESLKLAEKRFQVAHDAVEKLGLRTSERLVHVPGTGEVRQDLLCRTVGYYRDFVEQAKDNPELRADLAWTYGKIGKLYAEIGSNSDATEADQQAIQLYQELAKAKPGAADIRRQLGVCKNNLALVLDRAGKTEEARKAFAEAISLQEEVLDKAEDPNNCRADLAAACTSFGLLQAKTGDAQGAAASISRAVRMQQQVLDAEPDDPERLCQLAKTLINLGALYAEHQPDKASEQYEKAAAAQKRALELRPNDAVYLSDLVLAYNNLGMAQSRQEALAQAAETYAKVRDLSGELLRQSPSQKSYKYLRAVGFNNLGQAHNRMVGQATVAESDFRQALALQETLVKQDPADVQCQSALGGMYNNLGTVLEETKRPEDAVQAYEQAVAHQRVALASAPEVAHYRQLLSMHYFNYGRTLRQIGRPGDAAHIDLARRQLWPNDPQNLVSVAEDLASDARDLAKNGFASDINADACGAYAVETLKQATAAGWKPDPNSNWTKKFLAIKNRADFMALTKN